MQATIDVLYWIGIVALAGVIVVVGTAIIVHLLRQLVEEIRERDED